MSISATVMILAGMLLLSLLVTPLVRRFRFPLAAVLVLTGFLSSELIIYMGYETGLDYVIFHDLIFYVFLPLLVFDAAFKIDPILLRKNIVVILFLAIPILLLSIFITAALVYYGIGSESGFPWIAALITGAVLSATDASPITTCFAKMGVPKRLRVLMDGEDLFNDATAIVVFSIFIYIAMHPMEDISSADVILRFMIVFFGGILIGLIVGLGFLLLSRIFEDPIHQGIVTITSAYAAFLLANEVLNVSGVMAVLTTGIIMGRVIHNDFQDERGSFIDQFWSFNIYISEALVFLLMGVSVSWAMFEQRWLAMLIGIVALLVARAVGIFGAAPIISTLPMIEKIPVNYQKVMVLGSLRGAVVLALALSLPTSLSYWWTIQSIAFGTVIFSLFIQAPLMEPLLKQSSLIEKE